MATSSKSSSASYTTLPAPPYLGIPGSDEGSSSQTQQYIQALVNRYQEIQTNWQSQDVIYNAAKTSLAEAKQSVSDTQEVLHTLNSFYQTTESATKTMVQLVRFFDMTVPLILAAGDSINDAAVNAYQSFLDVQQAADAVEYSSAIISNYNAYLQGKSQLDPTQHTAYNQINVVSQVKSIEAAGDAALKQTQTAAEDTFVSLAQITKLKTMSEFFNQELTKGLRMLESMQSHTRAQLVVARKAYVSAKDAEELAQASMDSAMQLLEEYYDQLVILKAEITAAQSAAAGTNAKTATG